MQIHKSLCLKPNAHTWSEVIRRVDWSLSRAHSSWNFSLTASAYSSRDISGWSQVHSNKKHFWNSFVLSSGWYLGFGQGLNQLLRLLPPDSLLVDVSTLTVQTEIKPLHQELQIKRRDNWRDNSRRKFGSSLVEVYSTMTVNSYPISDKISRRAGDDDPSMIFKSCRRQEA